MAGIVVPISPLRTYDFSWLASVGQSMEFLLKRNIDVTEWTSGAMIVRIFSSDMTGGSLSIKAFADGASPDDPGLDFLSPRGDDIIFDSSFVPSCRVSTLLTGGSLGSGLRLVARATRTASTGAIQATFGVDVCLKNGV